MKCEIPEGFSKARQGWTSHLASYPVVKEICEVLKVSRMTCSPNNKNPETEIGVQSGIQKSKASELLKKFYFC